MIVLIDNYDSFTFNLFHYLGGLGADVVVHRNDKVAADQVMAMEPEAIVLSPGPSPYKADHGNMGNNQSSPWSRHICAARCTKTPRS